MPDGKRAGSATIFPFSSRLTCQQSSITTYWYPTSFMPLVAIASATDLTRSSLTLQANLFQLFQPIGGVWARLSRSDCAQMAEGLSARTSSASSHTQRLLRRRFIESLPRIFPSDEEPVPDLLAPMQGECEHSEHISPL